MSEASEFQKGYSIPEIEKIRKEQKFKFDYTLIDIILLLLRADDKPIKGKTRQMKEIFLTLNQVFPKPMVQPVQFDKHLFGPYSEYVKDSIDHLIFTSRIDVIGKTKKTNVAIEIASKGSLYIENKYKKLPSQIIEVLKIKRKEWESHIPRGLLSLVYRDHKEYLEHAVLKNRYKPLDWSNIKQRPEKFDS